MLSRAGDDPRLRDGREPQKANVVAVILNVHIAVTVLTLEVSGLGFSGFVL